MNDEEKLRELFTPAKHAAVALFKNDHDDGDTAVYQFITDIIPLLLAHDQQIALAARTEEVKEVYAACPFEPEDFVVDVKRNARGEEPLNTLSRYLEERLSTLKGQLEKSFSYQITRSNREIRDATLKQSQDKDNA